jgi:hypothetical protein
MGYIYIEAHIHSNAAAVEAMAASAATAAIAAANLSTVAVAAAAAIVPACGTKEPAGFAAAQLCIEETPCTNEAAQQCGGGGCDGSIGGDGCDCCGEFVDGRDGCGGGDCTGLRRTCDGRGCSNSLCVSVVTITTLVAIVSRMSSLSSSVNCEKPVFITEGWGLPLVTQG